jgi:hypothetical protein
VYSIYNNGARTALVYDLVEWGEFCVLSFNLYEEVTAMQIGF